MATQLDDLTKSYTSFSGTDMVATCNILGETIVLGTLQTISYSLHMDRKPIRSIGNINAKDYTQGPRTIAGSLVFAVFDKHILYHMAEVFNQGNGTYKSNAYTVLYEKYKSFTKNRHILSDELPPFDITITFANEYGNKAKLAIYGVQLVNEGQVMSINDIYTENTYQFTALDIDYLRADATAFEFEEEEEVEDTQTPTFNTDKEYNILDVISLEHINHDYTNSTSLLRITKTNLSGTNYIHDGILYIKNTNEPNSVYREYSIPDTNSNVYNKTLRLENGYYNAYFKETISGMETDNIDIYIHEPNRGYMPVIDSIVVKSLDGSPEHYRLYFKFRSLSAIMYGHNSLVVMRDSDMSSSSFKINDDGFGTACVPIDFFKSNESYSIYTSSSDKGTSLAEQILSHIYKLYFTNYNQYDILKYIDASISGKYKTIYNQLRNDIITSFDDKDMYSIPESLYMLCDEFIPDYNKSDLLELAQHLQDIEYNFIKNINILDNFQSDCNYCVDKILQPINDSVIMIPIGDDLDITNRRNNTDKITSLFTVKSYYQINKNNNAICSCKHTIFTDYRRNTDGDTLYE